MATRWPQRAGGWQARSLHHRIVASDKVGRWHVVQGVCVVVPRSHTGTGGGWGSKEAVLVERVVGPILK